MLNASKLDVPEHISCIFTNSIKYTEEILLQIWKGEQQGAIVEKGENE